MRTETETRLIKVGRQEFFKLPNGSCDVVQCVSGSLWITEHASSEDFVLSPGQSLRVGERLSVVIQGLKPSTMKLSQKRVAAIHKHSIRHALAVLMSTLESLHRLGLRG